MIGMWPAYRRSLRILVTCAVIGGTTALGDEAAKLPGAAERPIDFRNDIYPLLQKRCFACHKGDEPSSGYRLDERAALLGNGQRTLIVAGKSEASPLIQAVAGLLDGKEMPQEGRPLSAEQIGLLRAWIDAGVSWDYDLLPPATAPAKHWAFQPIRRPDPPRVKNVEAVRNPIDQFILAKEEAEGTPPPREVPLRTLIRRLSLNLLGLPPSPEEIAAFEQSAIRDSQSAIDAFAERLLASSHYGERWARHWLDVARWAETEGYESNHPRPFAWRYRDWVIESFNRDLPFTEFSLQQLAGDELMPYRDEHLIATGFLAAARLSSNEEDKPRQRNDVLVDIVNATGSAFLGLTLHCAQCHDHKFDPITQADYYRLQGFFVQGQPANLQLQDQALWDEFNSAKAPEYDSATQLKQVLYDAAERRLIAEAKQKIQFSPNQVEKAIADEDRKLYEELSKKLAELEKRMLPTPQTWAYYALTSPTQIKVLPMKGFYPLNFEQELLRAARPHLLVRGEVHQRGEALSPGVPGVLARDQSSDYSTRRQLAEWLTSRDNPLTARVWVNRLWQWHFGRGLVATAGDFGVKGARPTHPELLDWLAAEFMDHGWSTKHIQRLIVTSAAYRRGWQPRRIEAEAVRDSLLVVSGELDPRVGGPSVPLDQENQNSRRAIYQFQKREAPPHVQAIFDGPSAATESCSQRLVSTTALQPLYLLNHEFVLARAEKLADRVMRVASNDPERQVEAAFEIALGRSPDASELAWGSEFIRTSPQGLARFCHALLNLNEFIYLE